MSFVNKVKKSGVSYDIQDARINVTAEDIGKVLGVNADGELEFVDAKETVLVTLTVEDSLGGSGDTLYWYIPKGLTLNEVAKTNFNTLSYGNLGVLEIVEGAKIGIVGQSESSVQLYTDAEHTAAALGTAPINQDTTYYVTIIVE